MNYLNLVKQTYEHFGLELALPCTEQEIASLEKHIRRTLPPAYREFLGWMGRGAGGFLRGSFCFYEDLFDLTKISEQMLKQNRFRKKLPNDAFVFWMHQGYQFLYFCPSEGEDPPVHYYNEEEHDRDFERNCYSQFSEFLIREIIGHAQIIEMLTGVPNHSYQLYPQTVAVHPREYDAELGLLRDLISQFEGEQGRVYPDRTGTVRFVSQQEICIACQIAIKMVRDMYPNLNLEIVAGTA